MTVLTIKATIKISIVVSPTYISFSGYEGDILSRTIKITAEEEKPLEIEPVSFTMDDKIEYKIETIEPGKIFEIRFTNKIVEPGIYKGGLKLKTNYSDKPEISIPVRAKFIKRPEKKGTETSMKSMP